MTASTEKLILVSCDNYRRELEDAIRSEGFDDVELRTTPLLCGRPGARRRTDADRYIQEAHEANIRYVGCTCMCTPGDGHGHGRISREHGVYLFAPSAMLDELIAAGSYLVTPGWLLHWNKHIDHWGFDEALAREYFAESVESIVLVDTGIEPSAAEHLERFAAFVQRPHTRVVVGMDVLRLSLWRIVQEWRLKRQEGSAVIHIARAERQKADYAMAMDILGDLARTHTKIDTVAKIVELFTVLFAPKEIGFYGTGESGAATHHGGGPPAPDERADVRDFILCGEPYRYRDAEAGFFFRFTYDGATLGVIVLDRISFPEFMEHYIDLSVTISRVCGLALSNARIHDELLQSNESLRTALADVNTLSGLVPICSYCKKIRDDKGYWNILEAYIQERTEARFSHGICPECRDELSAEMHK